MTALYLTAKQNCKTPPQTTVDFTDIMAKPQKKQPTRPASPKVAKQLTLLERWETKLAANQKTALFVSLGISLLFSVLLFDVKVSEMNDDSMYIEGGYTFSQDIHQLASANAQLYPLFLSLPIKFFGVNLILLKSISVLFMLFALMFVFLAFKDRAPMVVLLPVALIVAVNSYIQYYASLTFTEAMFMFLQGIFIYYFFYVMDKTKGNNSLKSTWYYWLILGFWVFLLTFCKNLAIASIGIIALSFLLQKRYLHALYSICGILLIRFPTEQLKRAVWNMDQFNFQASVLQQIDPYDASKGMETTSGFVTRFFDNTGLYIAKRLYQVLGFVSSESMATPGALIFITSLLFLLALIFIIKNKNNYLLFSLIYTLVMLGTTFIVLQKQWDQPRYVMIFLPFILLLFFYGIYSMVIKSSSFTQLIYIIFIGIFFFSSFIASSSKVIKNFSTLKRNMQGDIYYGYTDDWANFLKMSAYVADSLPPTAFAASRKAPMSFIYGHGKKFYPIYTRFSQDADTILTNFKEAHVTHVIMASLRRNPKKADGQVITTMHGLLQTIVQKYPEKIVQVKQIGETEPAYLFEIKY